MKEVLKKLFRKNTRRTIRRNLNLLKSLLHWNNLDEIGRIYETDKIVGHHYTQHYSNHLKKMRYKKINLLEIGVGGYEDPKAGGDSLRMWKTYFPFATIYGIDIYDKKALEEKRIKIFQGSQIDPKFLDDVYSSAKSFDIIIDDGSHINEHVIETFKILFPKLNDGGIYAIEDTQTSYWEEFGGTSKDLKSEKTTMNFFKQLTDCLNHKELKIANYKPGYFDRKIISIHFYHNLIFIYKGDNNELSNVLG